MVEAVECLGPDFGDFFVQEILARAVMSDSDSDV